MDTDNYPSTTDTLVSPTQTLTVTLPQSLVTLLEAQAALPAYQGNISLVVQAAIQIILQPDQGDVFRQLSRTNAHLMQLQQRDTERQQQLDVLTKSNRLLAVRVAELVREVHEQTTQNYLTGQHMERLARTLTDLQRQWHPARR